jgi:hypothetical protein
MYKRMGVLLAAAALIGVTGVTSAQAAAPTSARTGMVATVAPAAANTPCGLPTSPNAGDHKFNTYSNCVLCLVGEAIHASTFGRDFYCVYNTSTGNTDEYYSGSVINP